MKFIYVIIGSVGECSDHKTWPVCAVDNEDAAQAFVLGCNRDARRIMNIYNDDIEEGNNIFWYGVDYPTIPEDIKWANMFDRNMRIPTYTGYRYWYDKVEML